MDLVTDAGMRAAAGAIMVKDLVDVDKKVVGTAAAYVLPWPLSFLPALVAVSRARDARMAEAQEVATPASPAAPPAPPPASSSAPPAASAQPAVTADAKLLARLEAEERTLAELRKALEDSATREADLKGQLQSIQARVDKLEEKGGNRQGQRQQQQP